MYKGARRKLGRFKLEDISEHNNNCREQRIKIKKAISIVKTEL
jgi:hypothetical protein